MAAIKDKGWNRLMRDVAATKSLVAAVGYPAGTGQAEAQHRPGMRKGRGKRTRRVAMIGPLGAGGLTNAQLAAIHELGSRRIPARPFIGPTFDEKQPELVKMAEGLAGKIFDGQSTPKRVLGLLGARLAGDIRTAVTATQGPGFGVTPLRLATVKRKGSDRPLVDTGQMIRALTWVVRERQA